MLIHNFVMILVPRCKGTVAHLCKRKGYFSKRDKDREREAENARECARDIIAEVICLSEVEHNSGVSTACPACLCCKLVDRRRMEEEIDHLTILIEELRVKESDLSAEKEANKNDDTNLKSF